MIAPSGFYKNYLKSDVTSSIFRNRIESTTLTIKHYENNRLRTCRLNVTKDGKGVVNAAIKMLIAPASPITSLNPPMNLIN